MDTFLEIQPEWDAAAKWLAQRGYTGQDSDPLPELISVQAAEYIANHSDEFEQAVRAEGYAMAMSKSAR